MHDDVTLYDAVTEQLILEAAEAKICNLTIVGGGTSVPVIENMCGDLTLEGQSVP
jgi:hypothetical protein